MTHIVGCRMRIIAGELKGRKLDRIEVKQTRPTSDHLRETIFNFLQHQVFVTTEQFVAAQVENFQIVIVPQS